ncbi:MAG: proton-conducting membrane transporter, partial [Oscillospiraceae bacterium]|nr:proton-conducting membrane transporter [Oscillospiraceae bacterium]
MNGLLLILAVLLPIVAGIASYVLPLSEKTRRIFCSCAIFATTVIGWLAILTCSEEKVVLFSFTDNLIFSLRMDGAAKLFVGLSATLWPFTTVYAWDYMKHEGHLPMFWAFFTASFGITLGIATASNMVTMYLFYELLTLSTIPLVMHAMHKKAIAAGIKYALYSIAGAALAFVGLVYLIVNDAQDFVLGGHFANFNGNM